MLTGILKPEWDEAATRGADAWEAAWKIWEKNVSLYEAQAVETISAGTKIAIVTRWAPNDIKAVIQQALGANAGDYDRLAQLVRDFVASGKVYESSGLRGDGPVPMDVGGIYDKGGKAKGKSKGTVKSNDKCNKCGKTGHWARDCWSSSGASGSSAKGGKSQGKSKGKDKTIKVQCDKCGKLGHLGKDCRSGIKCERCGKTGHKTSDCWSKDGEMKLITEGIESMWVMGITERVGAIVVDHEYVWVSIDSGSDADGCPLDFGHASDDVKNPAKVHLRTATNDSIQDCCERQV